ncbi:MAG: peptide chain release factor 1 [Candidatus Nealsonbacteria bacterium]|nr:peptide chain release factor 1 [Candidatus Nealsonbacteria bacterium]
MLSIENAKKQYEEILQQLSSPELLSNWDKFEELSKEKSRLEKIIAKDEELQDMKNKIEENKEIIKAQEDGELVSLAETEIVQLKEKEEKIEQELTALLNRKEEVSLTSPSAVIMEIRAGAGGDEAGLFAADLFKMYSKYADLQGWKQKTLDSNQTEVGGYKEIVFELQGKNAWQKMQNEGGVHRVQRIPTTEKQGRVHTSTASVAVLPKPKETQMKINPSDLKIEVAKASGPGGQNVNKRMTAVRIVHLPSGIAVDSKTERNLQQNKENALSILAARLFEKQEMARIETLGEKRRAQIKGAMRAEKIRTYNFPQDRITDHRIKKSFHNIEGIMAGEIEEIVEALDKFNE